MTSDDHADDDQPPAAEPDKEKEVMAATKKEDEVVEDKVQTNGENAPSKEDAASKVATTESGPAKPILHVKTQDEVQTPPAQPEAKQEEAPKTPTAANDEETELEDVSLDEPSSPSDERKLDPSQSPAATRPIVSEFSHQQLAQKEETPTEAAEDEWQDMPSYAPYDIYDDDGKLIAKEHEEELGVLPEYQTLGGAALGYSRVQMDEDAQSATSMDDNTAYLFKDTTTDLAMEDDDARDVVGQMQMTKQLLTDAQRIAYIGLVKLASADMVAKMGDMERTRGSKKLVALAQEALQLWAQKMMIRLYRHMELDTAEQVMIEQLSAHGITASDLVPSLMKSNNVKNPMHTEGEVAPNSQKPTQAESSETVPEVQDTESALKPKNLDIDLRWTVLCDLFLILVSDAVYDARSRVLLERVADNLGVPWIDVCRFEKRVTDALEMQEEAEKEDWDETEHMDQRRKRAKRRRMMLLGLATVGGGLVIGLSAGLLAPVIGAGLAAGFTTIGVSGTGTFLASTGAAAIIGTAGTATGGTIGLRAANRRTGSVRTFEYRPLYNNKRVNLIVTVAGWITGKVDDVRLPFSTVDPVMGDIYSVLWEPEMLRSMGDTINILATEALTQGLQQILGSTILIALMSALQAPILLTKLSYLIDNPWSVSVARADLAGLILADSIIDRNLGARPITLVGFSIGSRVIFSALRELAKKGALGLIQNVFLFGTPIVVKKDDYLKIRAIVSGRIVNGYATNDWILGYLFRATSGGLMRVAGLAPVNVEGIEDVDVTSLVAGHMQYRTSMPKLLLEVGWLIESEEFAEIEDPDPENHERRQRELINEIEEARKELEEKPEKRRFGLFRRSKKAAAKKTWETYDDRIRQGPEERVGDPNGNPMFDLEAIRREVVALAAEGVEVKELETTMPPMRIDGPTPAGSARTSGAGPRPVLSRPASEARYSGGSAPAPTGSKSFDDLPRHRSPLQHSHSHSRADDEESNSDNDDLRLQYQALSGEPGGPAGSAGSAGRSSSSRGGSRDASPGRADWQSGGFGFGSGFFKARQPASSTANSRGAPSPLHDAGPSAGPSKARSPSPAQPKSPWDRDDDDADEVTMSFESASPPREFGGGGFNGYASAGGWGAQRESRPPSTAPAGTWNARTDSADHNARAARTARADALRNVWADGGDDGDLGGSGSRDASRSKSRGKAAKANAQPASQPASQPATTAQAYDDDDDWQYNGHGRGRSDDISMTFE